MPNVYITQIPTRRDPVTGTLSPSVNIGPAAEHGNVIIMAAGGVNFYPTVDLVKQLRAHLNAYDYKAGDSIVAMGDPAIIAVACALLGNMFGEFILLKWDRNVHRYLPTHVRV